MGYKRGTTNAHADGWLVGAGAGGARSAREWETGQSRKPFTEAAM